MNQTKFNAFIKAAESINSDYASGYRRGLNRFKHGDNFGTEQEHETWQALGLNGDPRAELGEGYRDGVAGKAPRGFHANLGNMNAKGELNLDTQIQMRANTQVKAAFVKAAKKENMKLGPWMIKTCLAALEKNDD